MPATRQPLSVAIITLNAASQLEACLQSARFAEEIVVVDSGSTDGTQALAERHGARVIQSTGWASGHRSSLRLKRHATTGCSALMPTNG